MGKRRYEPGIDGWLDPLPAYIPRYCGSLIGSDTPVEVRRGYKCYTGQIARCYNRKEPAFRWYGAIGVRVGYERRDFVSWWIHHIRGFRGETPSISRIDHSKPYIFSNIKIEENRDNSIDGVLRADRTKRFRRPVRKVCVSTGEVLARYPHAEIAAKEAGVTHANIYAQAQYPQRKEWGKKTGFRYEFDQ